MVKILELTRSELNWIADGFAIRAADIDGDDYCVLVTDAPPTQGENLRALPQVILSRECLLALQQGDTVYPVPIIDGNVSDVPPFSLAVKRF
jgi:hypothetical protein